jgi:hypothetical protein
MARSVLEELVVEITTDASGLTSGLTTAEQRVDQSSGRISTSVAQIGRNVTAAVAAIGTVAVAAGSALFVAANRLANYADEIDKLSLRTRLSTDTLQELEFASTLAGLSINDVATAVTGLTRRLSGAEQGGDRQARAFAELGISVRDANGELRDTESIFLDSLAALAGVENETERATRAVELFGQSGERILPLLSEGPESLQAMRDRARELGTVIGGDDIARLVEYKDTLTEIQAAVTSISRSLVLAAMPILENVFVPLIRDAAFSLNEMTREWLESEDAGRQFGERVAELLLPLLRLVDLIRAAGLGFASFTNFVLGASAGVAASLRELVGQFEDYLTRLESFSTALADLSNPATFLRGVNQLRDLQREGLLESPFDPEAVASAGSLASLPFFEASEDQMRRAGEAAGRAFAAGYEEALGDAFAGLTTPQAAPPTDVQAVLDALEADLETIRGAWETQGLDPAGLGAALGARIQASIDQLQTEFAELVEDAILEELQRLLHEAVGTIGGSPAERLARLESDLASMGVDPFAGASTQGVGAVAAAPELFTEARFVIDRISGGVAALEDLATGVVHFVDAARLPLDAFEGDVLCASSENLESAVLIRDAAASIDRAAQSLRGGLPAGPAGDIDVDALVLGIVRGIRAGIPTGPAGDLDLGGGTVPIPVPAVGVQVFEEAGDELVDGATAAADVTRRASEAFNLSVVQSAVQFGANLASAIQSGSPSGIFSALGGGIASFIPGPAGLIFGMLTSLFAGFLPSSRRSEEPGRAAGAAVRGAPNVEFSVSQFNNLTLNGSELRETMSDANRELLRLIETNIVPRLERLEAGA